MPSCYSCNRSIVPPSPAASFENRIYHPECLKCNQCNRSVSGKQFLKETNGDLVCEECNAKTAPRCTKCRQMFAPGQQYKKLTDNIFYHNECFRCAGPCKKLIAAEFYEKDDDKFICVECYDKYGLDCDTNNNNNNDDDDTYNAPPPPIPQNRPAPAQTKDNNDNLVSNFDIKLNLNNNSSRDNAAAPPPAASHNRPNRFDDKSSSSKTVSVEVLPAVQRDSPSRNNEPAAAAAAAASAQRDSPSRNPYSNNSQPAARPANPSPSSSSSPSSSASASNNNDNTCAKCGQVLAGTCTVYNEKKYHTKCFVCCQCSQEFKEKTFFKLNGNPLCRDCHNKNLLESASKCQKCQKPILETVVTFKNGEYHDYCLICNLCSKKLIGQSIYTDKQDKPYCVECFTKKEAKKCAKCSRPIAPNETNLVFEEKNYHKECFACAECNRPINSSESFYKSDDGSNSIICASCVNKPRGNSAF